MQSHGKLLERPCASPFVYNRLKARDSISHAVGSKDAGMETPVSEMTLNGQCSHDVGSGSNEKPERYTRSSGIRPMHQSGWSFSGDLMSQFLEEHKNARRRRRQYLFCKRFTHLYFICIK